MELFDVISSAWTSLRANKTRTALTLLGMVIGVFAIITSVTAVKVIEVYFEEKMTFLGTGTFTISRYPSFSDRDFDYRPNITFEQVERLKEGLDGSFAVSAQEDFELTTVGFAGRETEPNVVVIGSDENFLGNFSYTIDYGRSFTAEDNRYARRLVVLGSAVADELFPSQTPLGKVVGVGGNSSP